MSWEIQYGILLLVTVVLWGAYGAWKTRDGEDGRG